MDDKKIKDNADHRQFDRIANDYQSWELHAQDLKYASSILSEKIEELDGLWKQFEEKKVVNNEIFKIAGLPMISLMLKGYAIEVFAKAIFIKKGNIVATDGRLLFSLAGANNHDLKSMLEGLGIILNEKENSALDKLSLIIANFGRYPITKKAAQAPLKDQGNGIPGRLFFPEEDNRIVTSLITRLESELNNLKKPEPSQNIIKKLIDLINTEGERIPSQIKFSDGSNTIGIPYEFDTYDGGHMDLLDTTTNISRSVSLHNVIDIITPR